MKKLFSLLMISLILIASLPLRVEAAGTIALSAASARAGDTVTVTGVNSPNAWVAVKAVDSPGNILVFDAVKASNTGAYSFSFTVPGSVSGTIRITAGYGANVASADLSINQPPPPAHTVTLAVNPPGAGTVSGGGSYALGASVTVTASATGGYTFVSWTEGGITVSSNAAYSFVMGAADRTLTANFTARGSGSESGGSANSTPAYKAIVSRAGESEPTLPVSVNTKTGNAAADLGTLAKDIFTGAGTAVLTVPSIPGVSSYTLTMPAADLSNLHGEGALTFSTGTGSVTIPSGMLAGIPGTEGSGAGITIARGDKSGLPEEVKTAVGDRPVVQLSLTLDGKQAEWNNPDAPVTVSIPYTPTAAELADPEHIVVWYIDGSGNVVSVPNGRYDPATGTVTFTTTHFSHYAVAYVHKTFSDLGGVEWARKPIEVMASKGIITGTGADSFSPAANITRADYLVLLIKTLGLTAEFNGNFDDVEPGAYYYEALGIAKKLGIAAGSGNNRFNPKESISRQDMMVLTARALEKFRGLKAVDANGLLDKYSDKGDIAGYAANSLATLVKEGLIKGSGDRLNPRANATRAEAAVFLYRIYNKY